MYTGEENAVRRNKGTRPDERERGNEFRYGRTGQRGEIALSMIALANKFSVRVGFRTKELIAAG